MNKIAFFGTPQIVLPSLDFLKQQQNTSLDLIIANESKKVGRKRIMTDPPSITFAKENDIPFYQTRHLAQDDTLWNQLQKGGYDFFIVFSFSHFFNQKFLNLPHRGCFNLHTSLLPKYRGASPIQHALLHGESQSGISLQKMVLKMDAGPLALQREIEISPTDDYLSLESKMAQEAPLLLKDFFQQEKNLTLQEQNEENISFASLIKKEQGHIFFTQETANDIFNKWRAFKLWPGIYTYFNSKRTKLLEIALHKKKNLLPNQVLCEEDKMLIGCSEGVIEVVTLQLEGKKPTSSADFLQGFKGKIVIDN